jgi:hypothetical protein
VDTPTARVVDLGTEFGMLVDDSATTHVEVFSGEVSLSKLSTPSLESRSARMFAGDVRRVSSDGMIGLAEPRRDGFVGVGGGRKSARSIDEIARQRRPSTRDSKVDESQWSTNLEIPQGSAEVSMQAGLFRIVNRGYLISREEFRPSAEQPIRVTGKFYWDGPTDSFQLATRGSGIPCDGAGELSDGLEFGYWPSHPEFTGILVRGDKLRVEDVHSEGKLEANPGMVLAFELVDRGDDVRFAIWQSSLPENRLTFSARVTHDSVLKHHVVLHNRERTEFENVLYVDGFKIEQPAATETHRSVDGNSPAKS